MTPVDIAMLNALVAEHYPCTVCKAPGVRWIAPGVQTCEAHHEECDAIARANHERVMASLREGKLTIKRTAEKEK